MGARGTTAALVAALSLVVASCAGDGTTEDTTSTTAGATTTTTENVTTTTETPVTTATSDDHSHSDDSMHGGTVDASELIPAILAAAAFQDVEEAEVAGYGNTMDALGCFENPGVGGMGLHYLNESLMDDVVDETQPEALVYELDANGDIVGLVAHEYIVPIEAWTEDDPPELFGIEFHQHGVLPLWILHAWLWKDNPAGMFEDWNPKARLCPDGIPVFGVDLP